MSARTKLRPKRSAYDKTLRAISDGLALKVLPEATVRHLQRSSFTGQNELIGLQRRFTPGGRFVGCEFAGNGRQLAPGANVFRGKRLSDIAEETLRLHGIDTRAMHRPQIAAMALSWNGPRLFMAAATSGGGEYNSSGSFPFLLQDAMNKTLLASWAEAPSTWRRWVREAEPVADFKEVHRVKIGGTGDLETIPDGQAFPQGTFADDEETYGIETKGRAFSYTRQMLINDDLDAMARFVTMMGRAAERTVNRCVYTCLTSNPTMRDSNSLFDATNHSNHLTSGTSPAATAPSVDALNAMQALLRTMTDPTNTDITLNHELRTIVAPAALEGTVLQLLASTANPAANHEGTANIWEHRCQPVIEPLLDTDSTTAWYGAGDFRDGDHLEVTFLAGEEQPIIDNEWDFDTKGRKFSVHQTFGVKAADWTNVVKNDGA